MTQKITVFELGGCCATSLMNPEVQNEQEKINQYALVLKDKGIDLMRVNVAMKPSMLLQIPGMNEYLDTNGMNTFPITVLDDKIVKDKSYPTKVEISQWSGIEL